MFASLFANRPDDLSWCYVRTSYLPPGRTTGTRAICAGSSAGSTRAACATTAAGARQRGLHKQDGQLATPAEGAENKSNVDKSYANLTASWLQRPCAQHNGPCRSRRSEQMNANGCSPTTLLENNLEITPANVQECSLEAPLANALRYVWRSFPEAF